ncbi:MAG: GNAT family N-acetyltransferase [Actinobacteria bacterium]|nr:MAG: GNAT family N-acetyltransferase [Actinomycetota bacterium]
MPDQTVPLSYADPPLTDGTVVLRRWAESDIGCVEEASREGRIPEGTTVPENFTVAEGLAWIERQWARADNGTGLSQAVADAGSNEALGAVVLMSRQSGTAEIGYWLIERARGRGLGSRAVALVARWAVSDARLARVEAFVEPVNIASQRVLEKVGFRREGHLRSYLVFNARRADAFIYSLLPSDLT